MCPFDHYFPSQFIVFISTGFIYPLILLSYDNRTIISVDFCYHGKVSIDFVT